MFEKIIWNGIMGLASLGLALSTLLTPFSEALDEIRPQAKEAEA